MTDLGERQTVAAGQQVAYELIGAGDPVLFLTNIAAEASAMRALAPVLNDAGHGLMLVEHLGPDDTPVERVAAHIGQLLDSLGLRAWVWGYSQGAYIAQELALMRPDRVRGAILVATRGRPTRFLQQYVAAAGEVADAGIPVAVATAFHLLATLSGEQLCDDAQVELASRAVVRTRAAADPSRHRRSVHASATYGDRLAALTGVRVPCLILSFGRDLVCPPQLGREVAAAIPGGVYREIAGAGHGGLVTHAEDVLDAVTAFLAGRDPA